MWTFSNTFSWCDKVLKKNSADVKNEYKQQLQSVLK